MRINNKRKKEPVKLLVFSDNHGDIDSVRKLLSEVEYDYTIFAGDWDENDTRLRNTFDFYVQGNNDFSEKNLKINVYFTIEKVTFFLTHGHYYGSLFSKVSFQKMVQEANKVNASVVIFGHSHVKEKVSKEGIIFFNPGSLTQPRDGNKGSYGIIEVLDGKIISLEHYIFNVKL